MTAADGQKAPPRWGRLLALLGVIVACTLMALRARWRVEARIRAMQQTGPRPVPQAGEGLEAAKTAEIGRRSYFLKDDAERAMGQLEDDLRQHPMSWVSWYNRGNAYLALERWDEAVQDYSRVLALHPNDAWTYVNRGLAQQKRGELQLALADQDRAVELDPSLANAYANRGWTYIYLEQADRAAADLEQAVRLDRDNPLAFNGLGTAYVLTGRPQQAVDAFTTALALKAPEGREEEYETLRGEIHNNRAAAYFNLAAYDKSRDDLQRAKMLGVEPAPDLVKRLEQVTWGAPSSN